METTSYFQSATSFRTPETIRFGVNVGPEINLALGVLTRGEDLDMGARQYQPPVHSYVRSNRH